ncbi:hypothetical protein [Nostoc phage YongM]|nr:hypothetical protein [Nostoc phage YongM]
MHKIELKRSCKKNYQKLYTIDTTTQTAKKDLAVYLFPPFLGIPRSQKTFFN